MGGEGQDYLLNIPNHSLIIQIHSDRGGALRASVIVASIEIIKSIKN